MKSKYLILIILLFFAFCKSKNGLNKDILTKHKWVISITDSCKSYLLFKKDMTGISYDCERNLSDDIKYKIIHDTLLIDEYNIPTEDNPEHKTIIEWSGSFLYTGHSLKLIKGTFFEISGKQISVNTPSDYEYAQK